jgi:hypothetical protein
MAGTACRRGHYRRGLCRRGEKKGEGRRRVAVHAGVPLGRAPTPARPPCLPQHHGRGTVRWGEEGKRWLAHLSMTKRDLDRVQL